MEIVPICLNGSLVLECFSVVIIESFFTILGVMSGITSLTTLRSLTPFLDSYIIT